MPTAAPARVARVRVPVAGPPPLARSGMSPQPRQASHRPPPRRPPGRNPLERSVGIQIPEHQPCRRSLRPRGLSDGVLWRPASGACNPDGCCGSLRPWSWPGAREGFCQAARNTPWPSLHTRSTSRGCPLTRAACSNPFRQELRRWCPAPPGAYATTCLRSSMGACSSTSLHSRTTSVSIRPSRKTHPSRKSSRHIETRRETCPFPTVSHFPSS